MSYIGNVLNALKGKESFVDSTATTSPVFASAGELFIYIIFLVILCFLYGYGAARLSYCYNIASGSSSSTALMWSILAYIFSGWSYPYYGVFLNPRCGASANRR